MDQSTTPSSKIDDIYEQIRQFVNEPILQMESIDRNRFKEIVNFVLASDRVQINMREMTSESAVEVQLLKEITNLYQGFIKNKDELLKYCIRSAFRFIQSKIQSEKHIKYRIINFRLKREAYDFLREKYFPNQQFHLPYKKYKAQYRTMNKKFLDILLTSEIFIKDFEEFLGEFLEFSELLNQRKIENLCSVIDFPIGDNVKLFNEANLALGRIRKRLPWPIQALRSSRDIGYELLKYRKFHHLEENLSIDNI